MDIHKNAALTVRGREEMAKRVLVDGLSKSAAAAEFRVSAKTVAKWVSRFREHGVEGLGDRSSRPLSSPSQTSAATAATVEALRRARLPGREIAREAGVSPATVSRILTRLGLNRLKAIEPAEPVRRYERATPGEIVHLDIKKLGRFNRIGHRITGDPRQASRGAGWEFAHVAIDDRSRVARVDLMPDEKKESAVAFLDATVAYYKRLGVEVARIMTDNGSCYRSKAFRKACRDLKIKHIFTKPYTPKTNGKAERFIQTALREWAYARAYNSSDERGRDLPLWLHRYNWHRPHAGCGGHPPISRLSLDGNNLVRFHI